MLLVVLALVIVIQSTAIYPPAQWCAEQTPWSWEAVRDCFLANATWSADTEMQAAKDQVVRYLQAHPHAVSRDPQEVVIYIHAAILADQLGGLLILDKILHAVWSNGLHQRASSTNVVVMGNISRVDELIAQYHRIRVIRDLHNLLPFNEFPTLALMRHHAEALHPDAKMLYLHTKGVTNPRDKMRAYMRDLMLHYNVFLFQQSLAILNKGYQASGLLLLTGRYVHYSGNFFWLTAAKVRANPLVTEMVWRWRFAAEKWPLSSGYDCHVFSPRFDIDDLNRRIMVRTVISKISELYVNLKNLTQACAS